MMYEQYWGKSDHKPCIGPKKWRPYVEHVVMVAKIAGCMVDASAVLRRNLAAALKINEDQVRSVVCWAAVWELCTDHKPEDFKKIDAAILSGEGLSEAKSCLSATLSGGDCQHIDQELCVGLAIHMPWSLVLATITASRYGVPHGMALHQLFCKGPHDNCF